MKRNIFKTLVLSILVSPLFASCELDQYPETNDTSDREWTSVSYADRFNTGLLSKLRSGTYGDMGCLMDAQTELFNLGGRATMFLTAHDWTYSADGYSGDALWYRNFTIISNANNILSKIDNVKPTSDVEAFMLSTYKANAYFARALAYASLAERYCENYVSAEDAAKKKGLPLIEVVDEDARPARENLFDTYAFILKDLEHAKQLYFLKEDNKHIASPGYLATVALEARVHLNMGSYASAIDAAKSVMPYYPLCTTERDFKKMWQFDASTEIIFQPIMTKDEKSSLYGAFIGWDLDEEKYRPEYYPTQGLLDKYESADYRKKVYFSKEETTAGQSLNASAIMVMKFPGNENLRKPGEDHGYYNMTKVLRVAELYLIAAEAQYKLDGTLSPYLNDLRKARGASQIEGSVTGDELFNTIKDEWMREMCGEGHYFMGKKRWGDAIDRSKMPTQNLPESYLRPATFTDLVVDPNGENKHLYKKIVWEIPSGDLTTNPNLDSNWSEE